MDTNNDVNSHINIICNPEFSYYLIGQIKKWCSIYRKKQTSERHIHNITSKAYILFKYRKRVKYSKILPYINLFHIEIEIEPFYLSEDCYLRFKSKEEKVTYLFRFSLYYRSIDKMVKLNEIFCYALLHENEIIDQAFVLQLKHGK